MKSKVTKQHVGIDISKDDFNACLMQRLDNDRIRVKASRKFKNTLPGYKTFIKWVLSKASVELTVSFSLEATGVYHENLAYYLYEQKHTVNVLLANTVKAFLKSLNVKTKTDKSDAKCIAQMGIERNLSPWKPISPQMRQLKQLTRERGSIQKERIALINQFHALNHSHLPNKEVLKLIKQRLKLLDSQLEKITGYIEQTIMKDDFLKERFEKICLLKGLGLITVATIIAETNGFQHFTSKSQLISYAGYDVIKKQSGSSINGKTRISKRGNARIRKAMHFPALTAVKYEPVFKLLYNRVYERTKIKMKGIVAVQRKLLIIIYSLFKNNVAFDPEFHIKLANIDEKNVGRT
jgi:transposase